MKRVDSKTFGSNGRGYWTGSGFVVVYAADDLATYGIWVQDDGALFVLPDKCRVRLA